MKKNIKKECQYCNQVKPDVKLREIDNPEHHNHGCIGKWCDICFKWLSE